MTREEKIEVLFESILLELEKLSKALENPYLGKVQGQPSDLDQKFENLSNKILNLKIPLYKPNLGPLSDKLDSIINQINTLRQPREQEVSIDQNLVPIPMINKLLFVLRKPLTIVMILVILVTSTCLNFYFTSVNVQYKEGYQKYQFLYFSGNDKYLEELDRNWRIDSIRADYLKFIQERKLELSQAKDVQSKGNMITDKMDSVKVKKN